MKLPKMEEKKKGIVAMELPKIGGKKNCSVVKIVGEDKRKKKLIGNVVTIGENLRVKKKIVALELPKSNNLKIILILCRIKILIMC